MFFDINFNLFSIVLGIATTLFGQWAWHKWFMKKPPEAIFALTPDEAGNIDVTSKLGPDSPEFRITSHKGIFEYTRPLTSTTDTENIEQGN